jgi:hypothetical protein
MDLAGLRGVRGGAARAGTSSSNGPQTRKLEARWASMVRLHSRRVCSISSWRGSRAAVVAPQRPRSRLRLIRRTLAQLAGLQGVLSALCVGERLLAVHFHPLGKVLLWFGLRSSSTDAPRMLLASRARRAGSASVASTSARAPGLQAELPLGRSLAEAWSTGWLRRWRAPQARAQRISSPLRGAAQRAARLTRPLASVGASAEVELPAPRGRRRSPPPPPPPAGAKQAMAASRSSNVAPFTLSRRGWCCPDWRAAV